MTAVDAAKKVTFKRPGTGRYLSSNGWVIQKDFGWAGLWTVFPSKEPPAGKKWKARTFHRLDLAKEWVKSQ